LWNCPPAAATESHIRDTTDLLETSLAISQWVRGGVLLSHTVWREHHIGSNSPLTGGQKHTHIPLSSLSLWTRRRRRRRRRSRREKRR